MRRLFRHLSVAILGLTMTVTAGATPQTPRAPHSAVFDITAGGTKIGAENATVVDTGTGWQITTSGRLNPPVDLTTSKAEVTYTREWQPQRLTIDGVSHGTTFSVAATFTETAATITVDRSGTRTNAVHTISPRTLVLPTNVFGTYEALALRLSTAQLGARFSIYVTGETEMAVTLNSVTPRRMTSPEGTFDLRQCDVTFTQPPGQTPGEIWIDREGYLARLIMPAQGIAVLRSDLSSVMIREERITHPGDESVFVPATGFNLAGTFSKPATPAGRMPAIVLVGSGVQDRDETAAGIPLFGQLAGALADAGYAVVRYDRRGTGQSGGRTETATLSTYADDVVHVVQWLYERKDIDRNRIAVIGYGEGGQLALLAGSRSKFINAIALLGAYGSTGRDIALGVQERELSRAGVTDAQKQEKIALQRRVLDAVATGQGWETIAPEIRRASDTPWFKSFVLFDPAVTLAKVPQPILIVHGSLDKQVPPAEADRLERAARGRKPAPRSTTAKTIIPDVNHLFVVAKTGEIDEYATLPTRTISPELTRTLTTWLQTAMQPKK